MKLRPLTDRDLNGHDPCCEMLSDISVDPFEVSMLLVEHRNHEQAWDPSLHCVLPNLLSTHLHTGCGSNDHQHGIGSIDPCHGITSEVEISGRVDEVDLGIHPLGVGQSQADGVLPFDLVWSVVGESCTVGN